MANYLASLQAVRMVSLMVVNTVGVMAAQLDSVMIVQVYLTVTLMVEKLATA